MFVSFRTLLILCALAPVAAQAHAQDAQRVERLAFRNGRASVSGSITGYQYVDYVFPLGASESLTVSLERIKGSPYFNLLAPGETESAFFVGSSSGDRFVGSAPMSGDYTARVYMMRSSARRGTTARYRLMIVAGANSATDARGPDFADGLTGGPDYWEVTGVTRGDTLTLRATPSSRGKAVATFSNGAPLRNMGCRFTRGQRWCHVEGNGRSGWVNGKFLREGAGPQ